MSLAFAESVLDRELCVSDEVIAELDYLGTRGLAGTTLDDVELITGEDWAGALMSFGVGRLHQIHLGSDVYEGRPVPGLGTTNWYDRMIVLHTLQLDAESPHALLTCDAPMRHYLGPVRSLGWIPLV